MSELAGEPTVVQHLVEELEPGSDPVGPFFLVTSYPSPSFPTLSLALWLSV